MQQSPGADRAADEAAIRGVLDLIQRSVRARDFEAVRPIIPDDALSFGSFDDAMVGYQQHRERQFEHVWPNTEDFTIHPESIRVHARGDLGWAACNFESYARGADGERVKRVGRMTLVLERRDGRWVQVHSHTSLLPGRKLY